MLTAELADLNRHCDHLVFADAEDDRLQVDKPAVSRCVLHRVGLKHAKFTEGSVVHTVFEEAYLRNASFLGVVLTGTRFERCNLSHATFDNSQLWYVEFRDCELPYANLLQNLPSQPNLRRRLLRSIRLNAHARGDYQWLNRLLLLELDTERDELRATFTGANEYFRNHFTVAERIQAFGAWAIRGFERIVWGYGLRIGVLLRTGIIVTLAFAVAYWLSSESYLVAGENAPRSLRWWESLFLSTTVLSTLGAASIVPTGGWGRLFVGLEGIAGAVFVGLVAAAAYRRIAK